MSRLLANLIIAGGSMLVKAASQAYQKALVNAQRSGVAQEAAKGTAASVFGKKTMALDEARMILGIDAGATLEEAMARYQKMFEANEKAQLLPTVQDSSREGADGARVWHRIGGGGGGRSGWGRGGRRRRCGGEREPQRRKGVRRERRRHRRQTQAVVLTRDSSTK